MPEPRLEQCKRNKNRSHENINFVLNFLKIGICLVDGAACL